MTILTPDICRSTVTTPELSRLMAQSFDLTRTDTGAIAMGGVIEARDHHSRQLPSIIKPFVLWRHAGTEMVSKYHFIQPFTPAVDKLAQTTSLPLTILAAMTSDNLRYRIDSEFSDIMMAELETPDGTEYEGRDIHFLTDGDLLLGWDGENDLSLILSDPDDLEEEDKEDMSEISDHICLSLPPSKSNHTRLHDAEKAKSLIDLMNAETNYRDPSFKFDVKSSDFAHI